MKRLDLFFFFLILQLCFRLPISSDPSYLQLSEIDEFPIAKSTPIAQLQFTYDVNSCLAEETLIGSASIFYASGTAILQVNGAGSAALSNKIRVYAQPGQGVSCVFAALYGNGDPDTNQFAGIGNDTDGFFFGLSNSVFSILYRNNGINEIISQSNWNVDPMDGTGPSGITLDFTKGNIFKIEYQQLEYSNIYFFIESPSTGKPLLVHQIEYANGFTSPSLSNPGLQLMAQAASSGGNAELTISSMGLFIEGDVNPHLGIRNSVSTSAVVNTTPINTLTIQNNTVFSSIANQLMVIPDQLSLFNTSGNNEDIIFSLYLNPTVDSPSFINVNAFSAVSYDISGGTFSGGILMGTFFLSSGSNMAINLGQYDIKLSPGDSLVLIGASTSSAITTYASFSWLEQF